MDKLIRGAYFHFSMTLYYSAKDFTCCKALTKGGHGMKLYYSPTMTLFLLLFLQNQRQALSLKPSVACQTLLPSERDCLAKSPLRVQTLAPTSHLSVSSQ